MISSVLSLLVIPVCILMTLSDLKKSVKAIALNIFVLLVFTLLTTVVLSAFTGAKRHEILASAAA